jgi:23S rRNA pseudouridine1911/1915/1917 synthase
VTVSAADNTATSEAPPRLDVWLAAQRSVTRHAAHTMIAAGLVTVNGRRGRPGQRIRDNDVVAVQDAVRLPGAGGTGGSGDAVGAPLGHLTPRRLATSRGPRERRSALGSPSAPTSVRLASETPRHHPSRPHEESPPHTPPLNIVYEDDALAVIDKPAGMVVHPAPGHRSGTLADALRARGSTWSLLGGEERAGIVHRLDRDTSGLLVVAKTEHAHRALAAQLRDRTLGRLYWAIVRGGIREDTGSIDAPIGRDPRNRKRMAVVDGGRAAITDFRVLERLGEVTLLEVRLRSGRTHQIRTHLAYIGRPIAGDALYCRDDPALGRPALHATRLTFTHPISADTRSFDSPPPQLLLDYLDAHRRGGR